MRKKPSKSRPKQRQSSTKTPQLANTANAAIRQPRVRLHRSFRRSYREDYIRPLELPSLLSHVFATFRTIFRYKHLFLPLLFIVAILNILFVGLMSEELYQQFQSSLDATSRQLGGVEIGNVAKAGLLLVSTVATGGLNQSPSDAQQLIGTLLFLVIWLVTIYLLRHALAGHAVRVRDGLYSALAPILSTLVVLLVMFFQAIPLMLVAIAYSAAIATDFLSTPFYALVFFILAILLILMSLYLLSGSALALVAVSTIGVYPLAALDSISQLIAGRRLKLILRLLFLVFIMAIVWILVLLPIILLDLWLKSSLTWLSGVPIVSVALLLVTCFTSVYVAAYFYLLYRHIIAYDESPDV